MNDRSVGNDADLIAFFDQPRLAERNREIRTWIFGAVIGLAVEMLVLQEHHGIVAADSRAQQPGYIQRRRRHHHPQPWTVREDRFATLAVIHGSAREVA